METLKRPEPPFRFCVHTTDSQIIVLFPGLHIRGAMNGIKMRVLAAFLDCIQDLVTDRGVDYFADVPSDPIGLRVELEKVCNDDYYNRFLYGLGRAFDAALVRLIEQAQKLQQETPEETDPMAYQEGWRPIRDEFSDTLTGLVAAHELKTV